MLTRALTVLAAASLLGGCHLTLPGGLACPARGGPPWREYRSKHFVVDTDLDRPAAAALVAQLETLQARVVVALTGEVREVPGYVRIVVPASERAFRSAVPPSLVGFFTVSDLWEQTIMVHPAALRDDPEVIAHELAHMFAWHWFPRQPTWFAEGFAEFIQTVGIEEPPEYRGAAGLLPRNLGTERGWILRSVPQIPVRSLLALRAGDPVSFHDYVWSWVLYHWLWNERSAQLSDYQRRLQRGDDPAAAWKGAFPDLDPDDPKAMKALDSALDAHRRRGELVYYRVNAQADPGFTDAPLAAGDVHLLLLRYRADAGGGAMLRTVLQDDPLNPLALSLRARAAGRSAPGEFRASATAHPKDSATAHPKDWRAWVFLGDALEGEGDGRERETAYRRAVAAEPGSALAQTRLAAYLAKSGRARDALPFAEDAVDLAPGIPEVLDAVAGVASDLGRCDEALALLRRAIDLGTQRKVEPIRQHLRDTEKRCRDGKAAAPRGLGTGSPGHP